MKARVVYIEQDKARRINEILAAEKEFIESERVDSKQLEIEPTTSEDILKAKSMSQAVSAESSL